MLIVHQMAKVASRSWVEAARSLATRDGAEPLHCHYISPANRARIAAALEVSSDRRTIANMLMPRDIVRAGAAGWDTLSAARRRGDMVQIITGIRDPVARSISLIVFMADFYGHTAKPLNPRVAPDLAQVSAFLRETWECVLAAREPAGSFEWLAWFLTGAYANWHESEFAPVFGAALLDAAEPRARMIETADTRALFYRVEDMHPQATGYDALLDAAGAFLQAPLKELPRVNTGDTRRSHALSAELRATFRLPPAMLDTIYDAPVLRRFYTAAERAAFHQRWSEATRTNIASAAQVALRPK